MGFRVPGADEYQESKFKPAAADRYRAVVDSYQIKRGEDAMGEFNKDGHEVVWFFLKPLAIEGDEEAVMVDTEENELPEDKTFIFFFDPTRLGYKPRLARSRKFIASALNVPVENPIEYNSLKDMCEDMLDREVVIQVAVTDAGKNKVEDVSPIPRRVRRTRTEKPSLVEAAKEVFKDEEPAVEPEAEAPDEDY